FCSLGFAELPDSLAPRAGDPTGDVLFEDSIEFPFPNRGFLAVEGLPALPYFEKTYALSDREAPVHVTVTSVEVGASEQVALPVLPQATLLAEGPELSGAPVAEFFPGYWIRAIPTGNALRVQFFPVQWNPRTQQRIRANEIRVRAESRPRNPPR